MIRLRHHHDLADIPALLEAQMSLRRLRERKARIDLRLDLTFAIHDQQLCVKDAPAMIDFYKRAFGATEVSRLVGPDGRVGHAEIRVGNGVIMLADEHPEMGIVSPNSLGQARPPVSIHLYVEDVDATYKRGLQAGATSMHEPENQFYGNRNAQLADSSGHV
jgi:PhnB protein